MATHDLDQTVKLLRTLAIPLRLELLVVLKKRGGHIGLPLILADLGEDRVSQSNVYEHLQALIGEGLVETKRVERKVFYGLGKGIADAVETLDALAKKLGPARDRGGEGGGQSGGNGCGGGR